MRCQFIHTAFGVRASRRMKAAHSASKTRVNALMLETHRSAFNRSAAGFRSRCDAPQHEAEQELEARGDYPCEMNLVLR